MPFKVSFTKTFLRDLKTFDKQFQAKIKEAMEEIHGDYTLGDVLKHELAGFISYHFCRRPDMRIIYIVYNCRVQKEAKHACFYEDVDHTDDELKTCEGLIEFLWVKTREELKNGYKIIKENSSRVRREIPSTGSNDSHENEIGLTP